MPLVLVKLEADEVQLINIVRGLKNDPGFGEFRGVVTGRRVVTVQETKNYKLN